MDEKLKRLFFFAHPFIKFNVPFRNPNIFVSELASGMACFSSMRDTSKDTEGCFFG